MTIFDIKRYAVNDGPGVRTTLFFKGCPLRCVWCHNPESWTAKPQRTYKQSKCIGCRTCVEACPQGALELTAEGIRPVEGVQCLLCSRCAEECPTKALEMCGKDWTLDDLMAEVEKERDIMEQSGGGVTLCGGEPLMQAEAALDLLRELGRRGFHRTVDTTLYADASIVKSVAKECELFLVDLKLMDSEKHRFYTGVGNEKILENTRLLCDLGAAFWIRIPIIEGVNADEENIEQTARFLSTLNWKTKQVNLLPYHDVGKDKHRRLWSHYNPQRLTMLTPSDETLERCKTAFEAYGLKTIIGG
ncbi:MAG: glycyl-radical enzyme activating protein [Bacteroidales bacterium]|nr:glycyl-radical enzyme activating protein [Bacteroidales bacterium]